MKNKKAAMEMSVGTIVTIVLLMSVLVLGLVLTKNIFGSAQGAIKMTDDQLTKEINKIYGEETELGIYPTSRILEIKQEETDEVGVVVKNLNEEVESSTFEYTISVMENQCPIEDSKALNYIKLGQTGVKTIKVGDSSVFRVRFAIPSNAPFCMIRYNVDVTADGAFYASDDFDLEITAK